MISPEVRDFLIRFSSLNLMALPPANPLPLLFEKKRGGEF
jgi:hypothetical protein